MIQTSINESARAGRAPCLAFAFAMLSCAAFAAAPTNEGGEYTYAGNPTDMRTTGQTGDQIWNVTSPLSIYGFFPG